MAAYHWVDDLQSPVACGLPASTLGSGQGPMLVNEYGEPLTFYHWLATCSAASLSSVRDENRRFGYTKF